MFLEDSAFVLFLMVLDPLIFFLVVPMWLLNSLIGTKVKYDPDLDFDPNSYSRMDKFDGLEVGQELIDSQLDAKPSSSTPADSEKK